MNEVIKFYNFEDAIEYSKKFKTDPKNLGQKLSIEILEEYQSVKGHDFTQIDNLIINFSDKNYKTIKLEALKFKSLIINVDTFYYSKINFKNCNGKISIRAFEENSKNSNLIIDINNSQLSIETEYKIILNIKGENVIFFNCQFKNSLDIFLFQKFSVNFNNCDFSKGVICQSANKYNQIINFDCCESNTFIIIKNCNLDIINSKFSVIDFCVDEVNQFYLRINSSEIDTIKIGKNQIIEVKSTLTRIFKISKIKQLELINGAKSLELSNCIIEKATINGEITDKAIFNNVTFTNPPEIGDIKFKNCNVEFRDVEFDIIESDKAIAGFRALNKACRDANYHHGEILFHGYMLKGRGKRLKYKSDFVEKLLSDAYKLFSDFGRSVNRPLVWLLILGFIFFGINYYEINKINNLKLSENSVISKSIVKNINNYEEEQNQINKINKEIVFRNAIGPLRIALPQDFIDKKKEELFYKNFNFLIYSLNIFYAFLSLGIWSIWLFMIRARFKL